MVDQEGAPGAVRTSARRFRRDRVRLVLGDGRGSALLLFLEPSRRGRRRRARSRGRQEPPRHRRERRRPGVLAGPYRRSPGAPAVPGPRLSLQSSRRQRALVQDQRPAALCRRRRLPRLPRRRLRRHRRARDAGASRRDPRGAAEDQPRAGAAQSALRHRPQQHDPRPVHVRRRAPAHRLQHALRRDVRAHPRSRPARHELRRSPRPSARDRHLPEERRRAIRRRPDLDGRGPHAEHAAPRACRRPHLLGLLPADAGRRLGRDARGRHRAQGGRARARRAEPPLRRRPQHHGPGPRHVRRRGPDHRLQPALRRALQAAAGADPARHLDPDRARAPARGRHRAEGARALSRPAADERLPGPREPLSARAPGRPHDADQPRADGDGGWVATHRGHHRAPPRRGAASRTWRATTR